MNRSIARRLAFMFAAVALFVFHDEQFHARLLVYVFPL